MTTRLRVRALCFTALLSLSLAACSQDDALDEPNLTSSAAETSGEEETQEASSTTVTTIYETEEKQEKTEAAPAEPAKKAEGPCEWTPMEQGSPGEEVYSFCDGRWAIVGIYATDAVGEFFWNGTEWEALAHDGRTTMTNHICYDLDRVRGMGAPEEFISKLIPCD